MTYTILYYEILVLVSATFTSHYKKCQDKRNTEIISRNKHNKITEQVRLKMNKESINEGEKFTPAKH
jgi:hypothetical protein